MKRIEHKRAAEKLLAGLGGSMYPQQDVAVAQVHATIAGGLDDLDWEEEA